jgi:hypothetical protein
MKAKFIFIFLVSLYTLMFTACNHKFRQNDHRGYYPDRDYKNHHYKDKKHEYEPYHWERPMPRHLPKSMAKYGKPGQKVNNNSTPSPAGSQSAPAAAPPKEAPADTPPQEKPAEEPHQ